MEDNKNINIIHVNGEEVILDSSRLAFSESTLSEYIETEAGYYDYFGAKLAQAERELQNADTIYEIVYSQKFAFYKEEDNCSDKLSEAKTKSDNDVVKAKKNVIEAKLIVRLLQQHLRSWDKNHENAQSRGHYLRKVMDKLGGEIKSVDEIIKPWEG